MKGLRLTSDYKRCPRCRTIIDDSNLQLALLSHPTPCCAHSGEARLIWPNPEALAFLEIAQDQDLTSPVGRRIAIVFLSTAMELLLEDSLRELLEAHVKTSKMFEYLLHTVRGRDNRLSLYSTLAGKKVRWIMTKTGNSPFNDGWERLVDARNKLSHGKYHYDRSVNPLIGKSLTQSLKAFAALQNYVRNGTGTIPRT
jgi:hypothetical protein